MFSGTRANRKETYRSVGWEILVIAAHLLLNVIRLAMEVHCHHHGLGNDIELGSLKREAGPVQRIVKAFPIHLRTCPRGLPCVRVSREDAIDYLSSSLPLTTSRKAVDSIIIMIYSIISMFSLLPPNAEFQRRLKRISGGSAQNTPKHGGWKLK